MNEIGLVEIILTSAAVVAAIGVLYKSLFINIWDWFRKLGQVMYKVDAISNELIPNGGGSLRDSIDRIEAKIIFNDERQKALIQDSDLLVFEADYQGRITWVNRTFVRKTGRSLEQLQGNGWINAIRESDRERVSNYWHLSVEQGIDMICRFSLKGYDDEEISVFCRAYSLKNIKGNPIGFVGICYEERTQQTY